MEQPCFFASHTSHEREHELLLGVAEDTEEALRAPELTAFQMSPRPSL